MSGIEIVAGLLGGVVLLLWGLQMVRVGVSRAFIWELRQLLGWSLGDRVRGIVSGALIAICLQSGTATALLLASFIDTLGVSGATALAVLLGADIGSAIMARVLSLEISILAPICLFVGFLLFQTKKQRRRRNVGRILFGLGLMLLALRLISEVAAVLGQAAAMETLITALSDEYVLILFAAGLLTWLLHSSLAMVLLIASLASHGVLPMQAACLFVLGANVGASMPALLGTLGSPPAVRRAPLANLLCRAAGAIVLAPFVGWFLPWLPWLGADSGVQIIWFHVLFNFALGAFWLFLSAPMLWVSKQLVPDHIDEDALPPRPMYLNADALATPAVALTNAIRETLRMGEYLETMLSMLSRALRSNDVELARRAGKMDDVIDNFYASIRNYLTEIDREYLSDEDSRRSVEIMIFVTNLEHIGDIIELSLAPDVTAKIKRRLSFPPEDEKTVEEFFEHIQEMMRLSFAVFHSGDRSGARRLLHEKTALRERKDAVINAHMVRLHQRGVEESLSSGAFLDELRDLHRIASHLASVAYPILQAAGELRHDRLREEDQASA